MLLLPEGSSLETDLSAADGVPWSEFDRHGKPQALYLNPYISPIPQV